MTPTSLPWIFLLLLPLKVTVIQTGFCVPRFYLSFFFNVFIWKTKITWRRKGRQKPIFLSTDLYHSPHHTHTCTLQKRKKKKIHNGPKPGAGAPFGVSHVMTKTQVCEFMHCLPRASGKKVDWGWENIQIRDGAIPKRWLSVRRTDSALAWRRTIQPQQAVFKFENLTKAISLGAQWGSLPVKTTCWEKWGLVWDLEDWDPS